MSETLFPIVGKKRLNRDNVLLILRAPEIARLARPGQFVNVLGRAYLRRPFGICRVDRASGDVYLGIRAKREGTRELTEREPGERLDVLGPLGHGFELEGLREVFAIGGGTGIYPLLFLADICRERGIRAAIATGFRSAEEALLLEEFGAAAADFAFALEDPEGKEALTAELRAAGARFSSAEPGYAQRALEALYRRRAPRETGGAADAALFACGPMAMMRRAAAWAAENGLPAQVSMEEHMACGFGVCRTCAVELSERAAGGKDLNYARCCVDGPVFPAEVIAWPSH